MKIRDLGTLNGKILLFGGAYSNLPALAALIAEADRRSIPPERMICTGDIAGYCADPAGTLSRFRALSAPAIAGNVERQLAAGAGDCGCGFAAGSTCDHLSAAWYGHADQNVGADDRDWMETLPDLAIFAHEGRRYVVVHGGLTDISRFLWPCSPDAEFSQEITAIEAAVGPVDGVIAGHCGIAFERVIDGVHWINAGAIGLAPHDGRRDTRFATLSEDGARIHRLSYDVDAAVKAMQAAGLTQGYDQAMETGLWPSQDILPDALRR